MQEIPNPAHFGFSSAGAWEPKNADVVLGKILKNRVWSPSRRAAVGYSQIQLS